MGSRLVRRSLVPRLLLLVLLFWGQLGPTPKSWPAPKSALNRGPIGANLGLGPIWRRFRGGANFRGGAKLAPSSAYPQNAPKTNIVNFRVVATFALNFRIAGVYPDMVLVTKWRQFGVEWGCKS